MSKPPLIGPAPQYPTPWRVAETRGNHHIVECADGHYTAEVPDGDLAQLICEAVNRMGGHEHRFPWPNLKGAPQSCECGKPSDLAGLSDTPPPKED